MRVRPGIAGPAIRSAPKWHGLGLTPRLFAAMSMVVVAGAVTLLAVAILVAPQVFHAHLRVVLGDLPPATLTHVDLAFANAMLLSLAMAVAVAVAAALTVTFLVSRRIATPVAELAAAARRLAGGEYDTRVPEPGLGPEFAALADSFNTMAGRISRTEHLRRRLLADLAHEWRTPVASIEATVEAIADGVLPADETSWATLIDQTQRLARLVADIDAVSRAEERGIILAPNLYRLADLAAAAVASAQARYSAKGVRLALAAEHTQPFVRVDANRFGEALANLLDNALRHTPPDGRVTITTGSEHYLGQDLARLTVVDTGDGFDPTDADRLFERFYRTDPARVRSGSGIGLTITKAIVTGHYGTIDAHSDGCGRGATFTITLPAQPAP
jgi:signal transduction histidine kinase